MSSEPSDTSSIALQMKSSLDYNYEAISVMSLLVFDTGELDQSFFFYGLGLISASY